MNTLNPMERHLLLDAFENYASQLGLIASTARALGGESGLETYREIDRRRIAVVTLSNKLRAATNICFQPSSDV